ncbi:response regulator, partial [candidate division WOR-3 bacterium]|nr:response regulator [candidate division WOR-3 bacterium]
MPTKTKLLVIDDEAGIRQSLVDVLGDEGYEVRTAAAGAAGLEAVEQEQPALVLLDVMLGGESGVDVLKRLKERRPETEVVMISGHATVDLAVEAIRSGAYDFLEKPLVRSRVLLT